MQEDVARHHQHLKEQTLWKREGWGGWENITDWTVTPHQDVQQLYELIHGHIKTNMFKSHLIPHNLSVPHLLRPWCHFLWHVVGYLEIRVGSYSRCLLNHRWCFNSGKTNNTEFRLINKESFDHALMATHLWHDRLDNYSPAFTRKTVLFSSSPRIWWESSLIRSTAIKVFPEPVFKQTIVLCSRAASRSSTWKCNWVKLFSKMQCTMNNNIKLFFFNSARMH